MGCSVSNSKPGRAAPNVACWEFEEAESRPACWLEDVEAVQAIAERLAAETAAAGNVGVAPPPEELLKGFVMDGPAVAATAAEGEDDLECLGELAPVCSVVGGMGAHNVLRAVSHVNRPLQNLFCYSLLVREGLGVEECFM